MKPKIYRVEVRQKSGVFKEFLYAYRKSAMKRFRKAHVNKIQADISELVDGYWHPAPRIETAATEDLYYPPQLDLFEDGHGVVAANSEP